MRRAVLAVLFLTSWLLTVAPANAAFPGANGKIAYDTNRDGNFEIYAVNPDFTGDTRLTNNAVPDIDPAWSPDGTKIVYLSFPPDGNANVWKMNANGTGQTQLTNLASDSDPSWSPDGTQIVFARIVGGLTEIYKMNADGTGQTRITNTAVDEHAPAWSPDGSKIAFHVIQDGDVYKMNVDGTGRTDLTPGIATDTNPSWSPDAAEIAFQRGNAIYKMNADGTGATTVANALASRTPAWSPDRLRIVYTTVVGAGDYNLTNSLTNGGGTSTFAASGDDQYPDWQPVVRGYARPRGATPIYVSLVPSYRDCNGSNNHHNVPLSYQSCSPPAAVSPYLTVGTPDFNGQAANFVGSVRMAVFCNGGAPGETPPCLTTAGDQLDGKLAVNLTAIRCVATGPGCSAGPLADYTDDLRLVAPVQITDKNSYGSGAATVQGFTLRANVPCTATADTTVGSSCSLTTTLDGLFGSGAVVEQKRATWESTGIYVFDGGADGIASTDGDNKQFAQPGLFFP